MKSEKQLEQRREVRAAVHRICLKRDPIETAANGLPEAQIEEALVSAGVSPQDEDARGWCEEDLADFSRAFLTSELLARRIGGVSKTAKPLRRSRKVTPAPKKAVSAAGAPSVADLLDGMLAQEKQG